MILVDASVWIDHLRSTDKDLVGLLDAGQVLTHPCVIGELALGNLKNRHSVLEALRRLPLSAIATDGEVLDFIEGHGLFGLGIGYVDAQLLTAAKLSAPASLWTRDRRLRAAADRLWLAATVP
ncbi:MAG: PIN domain-containing protein [Caulobacteraceae bacterium]